MNTKRYFGSLVVLMANLGGVAVAEEISAVSTRRMPVGQQITIHTTDKTYEAVMMDPATGRFEATIAAPGRSKSAPVSLFVIGATAGEQAGQGTMVFMNKVRTGLRMELGLGSRAEGSRQFSPPVTAIELGGVVPVAGGQVAGLDREA